MRPGTLAQAATLAHHKVINNKLVMIKQTTLIWQMVHNN